MNVLNDLAKQHTFIFIGYSLEDSDIREVLLNLGENLSVRMRSYIVAPHVKPEMERFLGTKKITALKASFSQFMSSLTESIDTSQILDRTTTNINESADNPILSKILSLPNKATETLINFITNDVLLPSSMSINGVSTPTEFYKGRNNYFLPISQELDVRRDIETGVLTDIFLQEQTGQRLYTILGHAGSGKTNFLYRLAFEAYNSLQLNCYFLKDGILLNSEAIVELYSFLQERVFLFVDKAHHNEIELHHLLEKCKREAIPITVITAERTNIWNVECNRIKSHHTHSYFLKYLTSNEIGQLIDLLEINNCLGYLTGKTKEVQFKEFEEKAGRELLVALYEATQGRTFQEIVCDEYHSIPEENAKSLYLTVCLLHSIGSYTRAGLLSRVHGIEFLEFKDRFFKPLEFLVFDRRDYYINDFVYESRHQIIAQFVIDGILTTEQMRYDEYILLLNNLDIDYDSDRYVFLHLTNARKLLSFFKDPEKIRQIYQVASKQSYNDAKLIQQEAIFEMDSAGGNINKAETLLYKANKLTDEKDPVIKHSLSELLLTRAISASSLLEKKKLLLDVERICAGLYKTKTPTAHPYHTAIKAKLYLLSIYLENGDDYAFEKLVKETESLIATAIQQFPKESHILEAESSFNEIINNQPKALDLLKKAYDANKNSPYLSRRLAAIYELKWRFAISN